MSYIQSTLIKGEEVTYHAQVSKWSLLPLIILGFLTLAFFGIGLIFLIAAYLKYISTELAVTNKRVIAKTGFVSRRSVEINLSKVEGVGIQQGIIGRMLGFGTIIISGSGSSHAPIAGICNPVDFRKHVLETTSEK